MKIFTFLVTFSFILINRLCGQDIRSGEIYFSSLDYDSIKAEIILYTQINTAINRDSITIQWGDGSEEAVAIANPNVIFPNVYKYFSIAYHHYLSQGLFQINVEVPNYVNDISNIQNSI